MNLLTRIFGNGSPQTRQPYRHRGTFRPKWESLPDAIAEDYKAGEPILNLCQKYKTDPAAARKKIVSLGVEIRRPGYKAGSHANHVSKLSAEQVAWVLEQDLKNVGHAEIARQVGVTRERIRQICLQAGNPTRASRLTKMSERLAALDARKLAKHERLIHLSELWKSGASREEFAEAAGFTSERGTCSYISYMRQRHPELFPYRMPNQWRAAGITKEEREERMRKVSRLWIAETPIKDLAKECGYKNSNSAYGSIQQFRINNPELFPPRYSRKVAPARVSELWKSGASVTEIARECGYRNTHSVYNAIAHWRETSPELFPERPTGKKPQQLVQEAA